MTVSEMLLGAMKGFLVSEPRYGYLLWDGEIISYSSSSTPVEVLQESSLFVRDMERCLQEYVSGVSDPVLDLMRTPKVFGRHWAAKYWLEAGV